MKPSYNKHYWLHRHWNIITLWNVPFEHDKFPPSLVLRDYDSSTICVFYFLTSPLIDLLSLYFYHLMFSLTSFILFITKYITANQERSASKYDVIHSLPTFLFSFIEMRSSGLNSEYDLKKRKWLYR